MFCYFSIIYYLFITSSVASFANIKSSKCEAIKSLISVTGFYYLGGVPYKSQPVKTLSGHYGHLLFFVKREF